MGPTVLGRGSSDPKYSCILIDLKMLENQHCHNISKGRSPKYVVHNLHTADCFEQWQQPNSFPIADSILPPVDWYLPLSRSSVVAGKEVYPMEIAQFYLHKENSPTC